MGTGRNSGSVLCGISMDRNQRRPKTRSQSPIAWRSKVRTRGLRRGGAAGRNKDVVVHDASTVVGVVDFGWWIEIVVPRLVKQESKCE
jgi:hypothetical protein